MLSFGVVIFYSGSFVVSCITMHFSVIFTFILFLFLQKKAN